MCLVAFIKPINPVLNPRARTFWLGYLTLAFLVTVFYYFADFINYSYLHKPLDASVLRFAEDFSISFDMMWQSYPIIWLLLALAVITIFYNYLLRRISFSLFKIARTAFTQNQQHYSRRWWHQTLFVTACVFIYIFGLFGKFSYYPLRWSDAFASTHPFAPAVTVNPVVHFFDTLKNKRVSFDLAQTQSYYNEMASYLGVKNPSDLNKYTAPDNALSTNAPENIPEPLNFKRHNNVQGTLAANQPNIIIVYLESFASYKTGVFGNTLNPTPHFDNIANNALFFKRFYTPHTGTARSVFTGITGIPDIELNKTSSRNPLIVNQHTLVNAFENHKKHYFLGGSANWGNIRGVLSRNIKNLTIHEEGSYSSDRVDVWGISDLDLFIEANAVLKKQIPPFLSIIQTSGNHRPYTIPEKNHDFKYVKQTKDDLEKNGFISEKEYNSFRFMDHSIGHFMTLAKKESYFDNTLFVFFGDHGISGYGGEHTPAFESEFDLTGNHVPFVIYAPKLIQKKVFNKVASQVDFLPTVAALASKGYTNTTLGRDLLNPKFDQQRSAFTIAHSSNSDLGLVLKDYYFKIRADGNSPRLYETQQIAAKSAQQKQKSQDVSQMFPQLTEKYKRLTLGIYETSKYMLYHNKSLNN